jgi:hypothetical protein
VTRAEVSLGTIEVEHDGTVTVEALREAVAVAGYAVEEAVSDRRRLPTFGTVAEGHENADR